MINLNATTPQLKAVKNLIEAYVNNTESPASKDYKYQTFPKVAELHDEEKGGHFERYAVLFSLMTKVEINVHETIEAPGKVILHLSAVCHTVDGDELDYDSLCIFTLAEEDGEPKVVDLKDFSDPEKRGKLHGWVAKALAKQAS